MACIYAKWFANLCSSLNSLPEQIKQRLQKSSRNDLLRQSKNFAPSISNIGRNCIASNVNQIEKKSIFIGFYLANGLKWRQQQRRQWKRILFLLLTKYTCYVRACVQMKAGAIVSARVHNVFYVYVRQSGVSFGCVSEHWYSNKNRKLPMQQQQQRKKGVT